MENRTLSDILILAKTGNMPTHDECYYAMLAMESLSIFDGIAFRRLASKPSKFLTPMKQYEESFNRWQKALNESPKEWLGTNNDPKLPEVAKRIKYSKKIYDKVSEKIGVLTNAT